MQRWKGPKTNSDCSVISACSHYSSFEAKSSMMVLLAHLWSRKTFSRKKEIVGKRRNERQQWEVVEWEHEQTRGRRGRKKEKAACYSEPPSLGLISHLHWAALTSRGPVCKFSSCPNNPLYTHTHTVVAQPLCPWTTHMESRKSATYSNLLHPSLSKLKICAVNVDLSCIVSKTLFSSISSICNK